MKKSELQKIIKEELQNILKEGFTNYINVYPLGSTEDGKVITKIEVKDPKNGYNSIILMLTKKEIDKFISNLKMIKNKSTI